MRRRMICGGAGGRVLRIAICMAVAWSAQCGFADATVGNLRCEYLGIRWASTFCTHG